jgi:hypothetical protein
VSDLLQHPHRKDQRRAINACRGTKPTCVVRFVHPYPDSSARMSACRETGEKSSPFLAESQFHKYEEWGRHLRLVHFRFEKFIISSKWLTARYQHFVRQYYMLIWNWKSNIRSSSNIKKELRLALLFYLLSVLPKQTYDFRSLAPFLFIHSSAHFLRTHVHYGPKSETAHLHTILIAYYYYYYYYYYFMGTHICLIIAKDTRELTKLTLQFFLDNDFPKV